MIDTDGPKVLKLFWDTVRAREIPFAVYRLPGSREPRVVIPDRVKKVEMEDLPQLNSLRGFIVFPFDEQNSSASGLFLETEEAAPLSALKRVTQVQEQKESILVPPKGEVPEPSGKGAYFGQVDSILKAIRSGEVDKAVLARPIVETSEALDPVQLFFALVERYPDAFVNLLFLPRNGVWCGATPETLMKVEGGELSTEALAGTQKDQGVEEPQWGEKEKEEQAFVERYIENKLKEMGLENFEKSAPRTIKAGQLLHLSTRFHVSLFQKEDMIGRFLQAVHPTPAVLGTPKGKALDLIRRTEDFDREYYAGFLGPWGLEMGTRLFVNLRCMKLAEGKQVVYAGGGITVDSDPEKEWEETKLKARTLLEVTENL